MDTVTKQLPIVVKTSSMGERLCCGHCDKTASNNQTNFGAFQAQLFSIKHSYYSTLQGSEDAVRPTNTISLFWTSVFV